MIKYLKRSINKYPDLKVFLKAPLNWIYAAYLTLRYVDTYKRFPAFRINGKVKIAIKKDRKSSLIIDERLVFEQWVNGDGCISITLSDYSVMHVHNEFVLGNGVWVFVASNASLIIKGRETETASGITANSVVMVKEYLEIGKDCLIAWNTFLTDCDWHGIEGKGSTKPTIIKDHIWIGVGVKVLKGSIINNDTIVTSNSVVLGGEYPECSYLSGLPAKVLDKKAPKWNREMIYD